MNSSEFEMRYRSRERPRKIKGEVAYLVHRSLAEKRHETVLTVSFMTSHRLFGLAYGYLQPDYFYNMPEDSGVYVCPVIPTPELISSSVQPGDIDLLVIPYERDELVLHRCLAIEIKAVRARFEKQGKSPNEYEFTQARGLLALGFPYVAVAHLIVSDRSPESAWREIGVARVISSDGEVELLPNRLVDWMPIDLTERVFGRLLQNGSRFPDVGLVAAYVGSTIEEVLHTDKASGEWYPVGRKASLNRNLNRIFLSNIANFFERNTHRFLDRPRFETDPT